MPADGIQDLRIFNIIFFSGQKCSQFCMKHKRIFALQLRDLQMMLLCHLQLFRIWHTFGTVMHKSRQHGLLQIIAIAHSKRTAGIHHTHRMLKTAVIHLFFQVFFQILDTDRIHFILPLFYFD